MSSPQPVELFTGKNWEECQKFILAVRAHALSQGKQRDSAWMADFAAPLFWHKALSWHCRLPEEVRQDWSKLEIALIDIWPEPEDDDGPHVAPTPAAAPSLARHGDAHRPLHGVLKVVLNESNTNYYVKFGLNFAALTTNLNEAIHVRCNPVSGTALLEWTDHTSHSWLAAHWSPSTPEIGNGSTDYARLTWVDSDTLESAWAHKGPMQLVKCTVLQNGEVIPVWKIDDNNKLTIVPFVGDSSFLYLVVDPEAYSRKFTSEIRAKFFLEPTD